MKDIVGDTPFPKYGYTNPWGFEVRRELLDREYKNVKRDPLLVEKNGEYLIPNNSQRDEKTLMYPVLEKSAVVIPVPTVEPPITTEELRSCDGIRKVGDATDTNIDRLFPHAQTPATFRADITVDGTLNSMSSDIFAGQQFYGNNDYQRIPAGRSAVYDADLFNIAVLREQIADLAALRATAAQ